MGYFYPPPPPFIGGRQPYAPHLGLPQSGPLPTPPPPQNGISLRIVDAIHRLEPLTVISLASFAGQAAPPNPGPYVNPSLAIILAQSQPTYQIRYQRYMADLIPAASAASQPPARSYVTLRIIVDANATQKYQVPHPPSAVPAQPVVTGATANAALVTRGFGLNSTITNLDLRFFDIAPGNVPNGTIGRIGVRAITGRFT